MNSESNPTNKPRHLDLFSGIGGFALAAQWAGFHTVGFSEIDPYASAVLRKHWPDVPNFGDIRKLDATRIRADLITGGVPCQPASCAGKRRGSADDRWLWDEAVRITAEVGPAWAVFENPPGIVSVELGRYAFGLESVHRAIAICLEFGGDSWAEIIGERELGLHHVSEALSAIGYTVQPIIVPAVGVDARHERARVWIVANSHGERLHWESIPVQPRGSFEAGVEIGGSGEAVADAKWKRRTGDQASEPGSLRASEGANQPQLHGENVPDTRRSLLQEWIRQQSLQSHEPAQWQPEPELGRVAHGIPRRVDRLRCLGNAIVPQVAAPILRAIREAWESEVKSNS